MDFWHQVRRYVLIEGHSKRSACTKFGIHWRTLQKILAHAEPPGYNLSWARPRYGYEPSPELLARLTPRQRQMIKPLDKLSREPQYVPSAPTQAR